MYHKVTDYETKKVNEKNTRKKKNSPTRGSNPQPCDDTFMVRVTRSTD